MGAGARKKREKEKHKNGLYRLNAMLPRPPLICSVGLGKKWHQNAQYIPLNNYVGCGDPAKSVRGG